MPGTLTHALEDTPSLVRPAPASHASPGGAGAATNVDAIAFPDGIPGFESCRRFVLLASDSLAPLQRIDSIDGSAASFLCIDPALVLPGYMCRATPGDLQRLEATPETRLLWLALVTVEPDGTVSANLRAPIVINPDRMIGRQVLPNDNGYAIRHILLRVD